MTQDVARTYPVARPALASRDVSDAIDYCMSAAESDGQGKLELRNMPTQQDRQMLNARVQSLLASFKQHDRKDIAIATMDMLASYDVAQVKQMTAAERKEATTLYVRELHGVPTWAVCEACNRIRLGSAPGISHQWKPTPIQVRVLAASIMEPWKREAAQISEILRAPRFIEGLSEEERERVGVKLRTFAVELKEAVVVERRKHDAFLQRCVERSHKEIARQWASLDTAPPKFTVSVTLARQIEERRRSEAQVANDPGYR
jgi:hypothetical protein